MLLPALAVFAAAAFALALGPDDPSAPSPDLSPEEVIRIQVEALQQNDTPTPDAGIEAAFRFASPANRAATGPLARFTAMVKGSYAAMLGFAEAEYGLLRVEGDRAMQLVTLVQPDGRRIAYVFALSRQEEGAYDGCWMTDSVMQVNTPALNGFPRV